MSVTDGIITSVTDLLDVTEVSFLVVPRRSEVFLKHRL